MVCVASLWAAHAAGALSMWHIYAAIGVSAAFQSLPWPAAVSAIVTLMPENKYGRANGFLQSANAVSSILAPLAAGLLLRRAGIGTVFAAAGVLLAGAVASIVLTSIPRHGGSTSASRSSYRHDYAEGWAYLRNNRMLFRLTAVLAFCSLAIAIATVLVQPLVLSFTSSAALGVVMSLAGLGMLAGSIAVSAGVAPVKDFRSILTLLAASGLCMVAAGAGRSMILIASAMVVYMSMQPMISSGVQTMIQSGVPAGLQGRMHSTLTAITLTMLPLGYPIAGALADRVFEPMLAAGGRLSDSVGALIGTGPGRGDAFMLMLLGLAIVTVSTALRTARPSRQAEGTVAGPAGAPVSVGDELL